MGSADKTLHDFSSTGLLAQEWMLHMVGGLPWLQHQPKHQMPRNIQDSVLPQRSRRLCFRGPRVPFLDLYSQVTKLYLGRHFQLCRHQCN